MLCREKFLPPFLFRLFYIYIEALEFDSLNEKITIILNVWYPLSQLILTAIDDVFLFCKMFKEFMT